ncbi:MULTISPECIES: di-heme oxidoredictase family protein [unclassified Rhizobium]|uniref:di-heme oxidoreductase family protein n=1 Tax=unclassified Rhizobium TaxID=2613769 RepID=UPI000EA95031|nr:MULTISPECIES: di-heme oxidoredictase family protein [unclassified Rhizobium]AYG64953.1 thiol oxidoreductase [Rhizobium sp. CCGE531]AYG71438.1 thiol oxidoreductase [Rhizobium sp. CCGE532]
MTSIPANRALLPALAAVFLVVSITLAAAGILDFPATRTDLASEQLTRVRDVTRATADFSKAEPYEAMQGGALTSIDPVNRDIFSQPSANLGSERGQDFHLGNALFRKLWVSAPSSTQASDGLGPLFNARSCQSCHIRDGRGHPPNVAGTAATSMVLRLARTAITPEEEQAIRDFHALNFPDSTYGAQLQDLAVPGLAAEGKVAVSYSEEMVTLAGGETVTLRKPAYGVSDLAYGPLDPTTTISQRIAPPMIGLGLIEAIADADILANADPDDKKGTGIRGRPAIVHDHRTGEVALGRFGWKAQNATVRDQVADAFSADIGISTPDRPNAYGDCTAKEPQCLAMPNGVQKRLGDTEAPDPVLPLVTFYSENLAVPARRKASFPDVLHGKEMFYRSGCAACHTPKFVTRDNLKGSDGKDSPQAFQLIWPYSDFLLHDMGEGLSDGQQVGVASGRDWRTPPLWGIGLTQTVSGRQTYLHDGRAGTLTEAILWHGGEAEKARNAFAGLSKDDRQALINFLESL